MAIGLVVLLDSIGFVSMPCTVPVKATAPWRRWMLSPAR